MPARLTKLFCLLIAAICLAGAQTPPFSFFTRHDILAAAPDSVGVADFNGDGIMDMAYVTPGGGVAVLLGKGDLTYIATFYEPPAGLGQLETLVIGDFNNDGHPDLAVGGFLSGVGVYINKGDGTFAGPATYGSGETSFGLATADVDRDGNLDLIGQGFVLLGLGNGVFETVAPLVRTSARRAGTVPAGAEPKATSVIGSPVAVGDFNGDGIVDVAYIGDDGGFALVYLGNGNGTFKQVRKTGCNASGASLAIADFNNDGIPDIASTLSGGDVALCLGNGDGTFRSLPFLSSGSSLLGQSIIAYDLNADGNMDIAVVDINRGGEGTLALASVMAILYGNGDGTFKPPVDYENIFPFGIAEGDLNGDGIPDLIVPGDEQTDPLIFVYLGTAGGKFESAPHFKPGVTAPEAFAFGDFNGDGNLDVAVTGSKSNNVGILLGNGKGGFTTGSTFDAGNGPIGVVSGDFNGDGKLDLAVANNGLDNVSILLGKGDGTFGPPDDFGAGQSPVFIVAGDFNGDGKLDLAVTNSRSDNVSILLGKGNGRFGSPTSFATGSEPEFIAVGDLNGDGKLDLAIANLAEGSVSVLFGKGDGTFEPAVTLSTGGLETAGIAIVDLNGDSKPDIVVSNFSNATVSVFLGNGAGAFSSPISSPVQPVDPFETGLASEPFGLAAGDFNGDGKVDVAVIAYSLQDIALLPGLGNGTFGPATLLGANAIPTAIASVPLTKGKPNDLVVVNPETGLVSVLANIGK